MLHVSTQKLILKLCELTAEGDLHWREGENRSAVLDAEGYIVEIADEPLTFRVLDAQGRELERADAADLVGVRWPQGEADFATHVRAMAAQAQRIARGTETAISKILSSLSAPPRTPPTTGARPDGDEAAPGAHTFAPPAAPQPEDHAFSTEGGPESEAAMAAAVADMALRLKRAPLDDPKAEPGAAIEPATPPAAMEGDAPQAPTSAQSDLEPALVSARADPVRVLGAAGSADRTVRSSEIFGRTRSFSQSTARTHHRPTQEARPVSSLGKITATGLLLTGISATTRQRPLTGAATDLDGPTTQAETAETSEPPRAVPPASPEAYKPWA